MVSYGHVLVETYDPVPDSGTGFFQRLPAGHPRTCGVITTCYITRQFALDACSDVNIVVEERKLFIVDKLSKMCFAKDSLQRHCCFQREEVFTDTGICGNRALVISVRKYDCPLYIIS